MYQNEYGKTLRASGRVTRKTVYGEKFDYGEKVKEKRNYILYVSGTGREKKEIEQIELAPPQTKILEERELIDNYQYRESKNIKKQNPNRLSFTRHKRLSSPFEKTTYKEVTEDGTELQSYTKNTVLRNQPITTTTLKSQTYSQSRRPMQRFGTETKKYSNFQNLNNFTKYENSYSYPQNETETKQDGDYIVKVTTTRRALNTSTGFDRNFNLGGTGQLKNAKRSGNNFSYYESKNVSKKATVSKPINTYHREERNLGGNLSFDRNLRSGGNVYTSKYQKKEVKSTSGFNNYNNGGKKYVQYQRTVKRGYK